ncbi:MAG TPA: hypothetical protein VIT00_15635 [Terrimicrobiaceae bacterium]
MNAILSRPALNAISFFIGASPCDKTREGVPASPFAPYKPVAAVVAVAGFPRRWAYPELRHYAPQVPELVSAFSERVFSAYWQ